MSRVDKVSVLPCDGSKSEYFWVPVAHAKDGVAQLVARRLPGFLVISKLSALVGFPGHLRAHKFLLLDTVDIDVTNKGL